VYGHNCLRSFRGILVVVYPLQHDSTLKKKFESKVFFQKWNDSDNENPEQKSVKRELGKDK